MVSQGPLLERRVCNNKITLFFGKGDAVSLSEHEVPSASYSRLGLCLRTSCEVALKVPNLWTRTWKLSGGG